MKYPINLTNKPVRARPGISWSLIYYDYMQKFSQNVISFRSNRKKTCQSSPVLFDEIQHNKIITMQCHILQSTTVTKIT